MELLHGTDRRDGTAISQQHYEVGDELVEAFREEGLTSPIGRSVTGSPVQASATLT